MTQIGDVTVALPMGARRVQRMTEDGSGSPEAMPLVKLSVGGAPRATSLYSSKRFSTLGR